MADDTKLRSLRSNGSDEFTGRADRASAAADPLAELARLIGQDNVFDQMRRDAASTRTRSGGAAARPAMEPVFSAPPRAASAASNDLRGSYDAFAGVAPEEPYIPIAPTSAPRDRVAYQDEPEAHGYSAHYSDAQGHAYHDDPQGTYADPYYDDGLPEGHGAPEAYDSHGLDGAEETPRRRRRVGVAAVAAVLGLAAIGTAGAFGYRALTGGTEGGQVPIIKADNSPAKVVPPAGGEKESGKLLYDRVDKGQSETVVPREEQPVDMREARGAAPKLMVPPAGAGVPAAGSSPLTTGSTSALNPNEPKKVRTFAIRPDGTAAGPDSAASKSAVSAGSRVANIVPTTPKPVTTRSIPVTPETGAARPPADVPARTASLPTTAPATPSVNAPAPPAGGHVVQLSSQKSETEAQASFRALQAKYPGVLSGRQPIIRRVELGSKGTFYRAQVGPFASLDQANELCSSLKAAGGQCVVQRN